MQVFQNHHRIFIRTKPFKERVMSFLVVLGVAELLLDLKSILAGKSNCNVSNISRFEFLEKIQKQPLTGGLQNRCSEKSRRIHWETPAVKSLFQ